MAAEFIRIGILQEGEYFGMLRRLCDGSEVTAATCEWVLEAICAWEEGRPDGERVHQENRLEVYSDVLEKCLVPCLLGILGSHSTKSSTHQYHITHVSVVSNDSVTTEKDIFFQKEMDNGVTSINNDILNNTIKEKGSEMNELKLIPKLSYLVSYLLRILSRSPCEIRNTDSKDVILKEVLETIYLSLSDLCLDGIIIENELHRIKILSLSFSNLLKDKLCQQTEDLISHVRKVIEIALSLVKASHDADITALLLTLVIQPCIENQKMKDDIIISLWHIVKGFYVSGEDFITEENNSTGFIILCFLSEHIFKANLVLENEDMLWKIIQYGLIHTNPLSRKRSQYILKRAVDMYACLNSTHACSVSKYMPFQSKRLKEFERLWYDFFLLIETLEEKQAHVVKPVLEKLDKLISESIKNGNREIHMSWILIIFHRVFNHDNKSIRQWGLTKFLNIKLPEEVLVNGFLSFVTLHLLSVLSDYSYYARYPGQPRRMSSSVGDHLVLFFTNTVDSLSLSMQKYFMCSVLETIFDGRPWGAVPLFYMIRSLSQIPSTRVWNYKVVKNAVVNFEGCLSTQDVSLRSASQCDFLRAVLKHLSSETTLIEICDIIGHLRRKESWCRGTSIWDTVIDSLDVFTDNYENSSVHAALATSMSSLHSLDVVHPPDVALGINFLMEKYYKKNENHNSKFWAESLLKPLTDFLKDCHLRPYLDQKKLAWTLEVLAVTLQIMYEVPDNNLEVEKKHDGDLSCFVDGIISVTQLFINHLDKLNQPHDLDMINLYLRVFAACNRSTPLKLTMRNHYIQIFDKCKSLLEKTDPVKVSYGIIIMEHLLLFHFGDSKNNIKEEYHQIVLQKIIHDIQPLTQRRTIKGYRSSEITSSLLLETTRSCWSSVDMLIRKKEISFIGILEETEKSVVAILPDAVSTVGRLNAQHIYQVAVNLAPAIIKAGIWQDLVEHMWTSSSEFKKGCDLYRFLICCITDLLFHKDAMVKPEWQEFIVQIAQKLLMAGEAVQGIAAYMSRSLVLTLSDLAARDALTPEAMSLFTQEIFVPLAMFGYVFKKQFRVIQDTIEYIKDCGTNYSSNILLESNWDADQRARAITLRFLLSLSKEIPVDKQIARAITQGIRFQYMKCSGDRRDYGNSQTHRYKTRLLQAFMLLLPLLDEEECLLSLSWLCRGLIKDHQQPSVRYMQEWGVSLIIIFHPNFYPLLLKHFSEGAKERVGCVGSFLAALTHVACTTEDQEVLSQSIQHSLPWCMAQHFNTRLYAQVSLRKIWHHCRMVNATSVLEKFEPIQQCLQFVVEQGSAARNTLNMLNDFYFKVFHPVQHYTLQTIVYDLPCLSLLADDEWLKVDFIMCAVNLSMLTVRSEIPLYNKDKVLEESTPAPWVVKAAGESTVAEESEMPENSILNVQRKITPWKSMISELTASLDLPNMDEPRQQRGSLILVASLIDKPPNLGGLCRTCEVFSVREYVVPSLGVLEDQTFNSLSLTAQQWVPVKEVKPDDLAAYLKTLQNDGYTLVAAEQTANSKKLSEFSFPERTAVILGNEREGIPCELLQLLDVCVEIPQSGIIRSLNVHVSGALFIWEYTRQHLTRLSSA